MEGLMKLEEAGSPVKLAISDVEMPRMNGIEFAGKLRALHPDTRILLTSGNPAVGEQAHGLPSDAFLPKPYTANELLGRVWKLLRD
jgi:DNA-binding response OmpR family regulator